MIDGNISMEEDTELRDLVVQTLENNGVLAKVRAELRASVFLTLEEQETVLNSEPFLNKSVKQYLANSEGKLLFSLVREFLEYFGLDYTMSVYDPETYFGKEYNYVGRKKLCEELGINSKEPLLGEILRNSINSALKKIQNSDCFNMKSEKPNAADDIANATFDISIPKILQKDSMSTFVDTSDNSDNLSTCNLQLPINVKITDKKQYCNLTDSEGVKNVVQDISKSSSIKTVEKNMNENTNLQSTMSAIQNPEMCETKITTEYNTTEFQTLNYKKNKNPNDSSNNMGNTIYFDEVIVDGIKEKIAGTQSQELEHDELPSLLSTLKNDLVFSDLPPLNGKKADITGLKELMDIAQGVSEYEEEFISTSDNTIKGSTNYSDSIQNIQNGNENREIN